MEVSESEADAIIGHSPVPLERTNTCNTSEWYPVFCKGVPVSRWKASATAYYSQAVGCTPSLRAILPCSAWNCHQEEPVIPSRREICDIWKFVTTGDISLSAMTVYATVSSSASTTDVSAARGLQQDDETDSSSITTKSGVPAQISSTPPLLIEIRDKHKAVTGDEEALCETLSESLSTEIHWEQALSKFRLSEEEDFVQKMKREFRRRREEKKNKINGESEKEALRNRIKGTLFKLRTKGMSLKAIELKRQQLQEQEEKNKMKQGTMENSQMNDEPIETESKPSEEQTELDPKSEPLVSEKEVTTTDTFVEQDYNVDASGFITFDVENNGTAASGDDDITGAFEVSVKKNVRFAEEVQVRTPSSSVDSISSNMEGRQPSEADSASDSIRADNSEEDSSKWWIEDGYNGKRDAVGVTTSTWGMDSVDTVEWLSPTTMGMLEEKPLLGLGRPESPRSKALRKNRRKARRKSLSPSPQVQHIQQKLLQLHCGASKARHRLY